MGELLSAREYAAHKGVSHNVVSRKIKRKQLSKCLVYFKDKAYPKIDKEIADQEWDATCNIDQVFNHAMSKAMGTATKVTRNTAKKPDEKPKKTTAKKGKDSKKESKEPEKKTVEVQQEPTFKALTDARTEKEHYEARLRRLKYEKESGQLLDAEEVRKEIMKLTTMTKEAILNIPDKLGPELLAFDNLVELQNFLRAALNEALEKLGGKDIGGES